MNKLNAKAVAVSVLSLIITLNGARAEESHSTSPPSEPIICQASCEYYLSQTVFGDFHFVIYKGTLKDGSELAQSRSISSAPTSADCIVSAQNFCTVEKHCDGYEITSPTIFSGTIYVGCN